ncbi:TPA: 50S ribosomal protein L24 [candidate division CPR2 bacterium]|uniref:Large ribosomal subunit protein uL24 n=1 Tax=candidate division CPR2 bacterium GW2011_GWC1_41_48 TaxID=1618344 RepID=A0A0G0Z741_UNCC2|nr:MAG: 50S ribosomal protein L24 [candidate division CPR2 bacterium GW2011_GWC2_39_35]KKR27162.1 MAG: 50S ribosomal protein L24 [candidate division CPR2 bacterium GW2011_GWD2_39_7]KKR27393.1 MAG: 50S ribosomal protein L24 [candidate division CPR2 bacterium GW2011_GWD1_39_7]KKS08848.1 MAG: Ribosomal protein L24 [candidate division CPR2 bacterium GW2011_GWC1_41_48]OGB58566.1 MAG: 50S ribosomal protein L24 [candidate division CPR2 bacterium GWD1_39_7]OGB70311.1 MAG: 50S ribosomal protein L24 [ca
MKVKKNDTVLITVGKDQGKTGKVVQVISKTEKVMVEGINIHKKAVKPSTKTPAGGIIEVTAPVCVSNVAVVCPRCNKPARMGYELVKDDKVRVCKRCKERI